MAGCVFPVSEAIRSHHGPNSWIKIVDYALVDAFTDVAFKGNPAAVCLLPRFSDEKWMQNVAAEFSAPMTAFLVKREAFSNHENGISEEANANGAIKCSPIPVATLDEFRKVGIFDKEFGGNSQALRICTSGEKATHYDIKWFTVQKECRICGHATLASAYLLFKSGQAPGSTIYFHTMYSGLMSARKVFVKEEGNDDEEWHGVVELCFPSLKLTPYALKDSLISLPRTLKGSTVIASFKDQENNFLLELGSAEEVATLETHTEELMTFDARGLIITARGDAESPYDCVSRFFIPKYGIPEDPVCGSAHCALAPYWAGKLGKKRLLAYQASKRGGVLDLRVDDTAGRVFLQGTAVIVTAGILFK